VRAIISTRGLTISTTYKDAVTRKLEKLERLLPKLIEAKIVLSREKHRRTAALTLVSKKHTFHSEETAEDLAQAVDLAVAALGRQVRHVKDRGRQHKPRRRAAAPAGAVEGSAVAPPEREVSPESGAPGEADLVVRRVAPKPMSVEEAIEQFRLGPDQFLVFTNARTEVVNVLYRRKDGGLGLIEPVA
jgi:putative sigma-54 modulation protein